MSEKRNSAYLNARFKYILFLRHAVKSNINVKLCMQPPGQPVHEQKDITRASNAVAEAGAFFKQTPEEEKSNGEQVNSVFTFSM